MKMSQGYHENSDATRSLNIPTSQLCFWLLQREEGAEITVFSIEERRLNEQNILIRYSARHRKKGYFATQSLTVTMEERPNEIN